MAVIAEPLPEGRNELLKGLWSTYHTGIIRGHRIGPQFLVHWVLKVYNPLPVFDHGSHGAQEAAGEGKAPAAHAGDQRKSAKAAFRRRNVTNSWRPSMRVQVVVG